MYINKNSGSNKNGRNRSFLQQRSSSQPPFLKCSTRFLVLFLVLIIVAYLVILSSFLPIVDSNNDHEQIVVKQSRVEVPELVVESKKNVKKNIDNHNHDGGDDDDGRITIGVASTITGCGSDPFVDGAAVLKYSLDVHSKSAESKYKYKTYIFYHPSAKECVLPLANLGYTLLERPTPIKVEEIGGDGFLRERIVVTGCCGEVSQKYFNCRVVLCCIVVLCCVVLCSIVLRFSIRNKRQTKRLHLTLYNRPINESILTSSYNSLLFSSGLTL